MATKKAPARTAKKAAARKTAAKKTAAKKPAKKSPARKPAANKAAAKKAPAKKAATKKTAAKKAAASKPRLLAGGNPQIPKGDGNAPVQAYLAAIPGWKQPIAKRLDRLITRAAPGVRKAVKWNSPFYGAKDQEGWFLNLHCFTRYIKVAFFNGGALKPPPPEGSKHPHMRYLHVTEDGAFDQAQFIRWVKQAIELPGEKM